MTADRVRLRCDVAYDGTNFSGWAKQPGLRTVQGVLEGALAMLLRRDEGEVSLTVGGRTDAGVHARGQVCHLDVMASDLERFRGRRDASLSARKLNGVLRRMDAVDIAAIEVREVPITFDARFSAISRRYEYLVRPKGVRPDPLERFTVVDLKHSVDVNLLRQVSSELTGLRDFAAFCKAREGATSVRTLIEFSWDTRPTGVLAARIEADAFCHSMVRSLVGGVLAVASGRVPIEDFRHLSDARERSSRIPVMPPHGLSLEEIRYPSDELLARRAEQTRAKRAPLP